MARSNLVARSLNDLGLAAWFGGSLMGATATNRAPVAIEDEVERDRVSNAVWDRWWPIEAGAMALHLVGGALLTIGNRERLVAQRGVATLSLVRTAVMAGAVGSTLWAGRLGRRLSAAGDVPLHDATTPSTATPAELRPTLASLSRAQWLVPALTGVIVVLNAAQGEQQRPSRSLRGVLRRLDPTS